MKFSSKDCFIFCTVTIVTKPSILDVCGAPNYTSEYISVLIRDFFVLFYESISSRSSHFTHPWKQQKVQRFPVFSRACIMGTFAKNGLISKRYMKVCMVIKIFVYFICISKYSHIIELIWKLSIGLRSIIQAVFPFVQYFHFLEINSHEIVANL